MTAREQGNAFFIFLVIPHSREAIIKQIYSLLLFLSAVPTHETFLKVIKYVVLLVVPKFTRHLDTGGVFFRFYLCEESRSNREIIHLSGKLTDIRYLPDVIKFSKSLI